MADSRFDKSKIIASKIPLVIEDSKGSMRKICFRGIRHEKSDDLIANDFMPTFIEKNNYSVPDASIQEGQSVASYFGMSLYESLPALRNACKSIRSLRKIKSFAQGFTDEAKGTTSCPDPFTHFQYYLFDPFGNNPYCDFRYVDNEEEKQ